MLVPSPRMAAMGRMRSPREARCFTPPHLPRKSTALGLMAKHHAIEDTVGRARHYGAIATDALALVPQSDIKTALEETVAFCIARAH